MSALTPPYVTHAGNQTLYLAAGTPIVNTLQALTGSVTLTSPDSSITITPSGQTIQLQTGSSSVQSVSAGTGGVTITGTATNPIVNVPDAVQSVSAGTGGVTITGTATAPVVNVPVIPNSTLVISDYTSTAGTLALTGTFAAQGSVTLTTTQDSAPINIWGNLNVFHPTGGGGGAAVVEARLVIGTTPQQIGATVSTTVDNGHYQTIPLIYKGTGSATAGSVNILLQARVVSGSVNRVSAQVMAIGQMLNA